MTVDADSSAMILFWAAPIDELFTHVASSVAALRARVGDVVQLFAIALPHRRGVVHAVAPEADEAGKRWFFQRAS